MAKFLERFRALLAVLFNRPLRVKFGAAGEAHFHPAAGRVLPIIAGADGDGEGGDGEGSGEGSGGDGDGESGDGDGSGEGDGEPGKEGDGKDWREELRRYERNAKKRGEKKDKEIEGLRDKLQKKEDAEKSEHEKALESARKEARNEALTESEKERRADRLESTVVRLAGKKLEIGEGDKAKKVRFEDPEDAEVFLRRKVQNGDVDEDELFDENGKVNARLVEETLREILTEKPRLAEHVEPTGPTTPEGGGDGGRGREAAAEGDMNAALRRGRS
jgi:hypothetical protein